MAGNESWMELQIETGVDAADLVAAAVAPLTGGVELRDSETVFATAPDRTIVIALCQPEEVNDVLETVNETLELARAGGTQVDPVAIRQRLAHEDEWRDVWKQFFRATRVGRRFTVRPSWDPGAAPEGEFIVDLDPGRAFGTGAHPSTRLVIGFAETLSETMPNLTRFLDLGCGSGILSIVGAWLWPKARGLAVDLDPDSAACTLENFERNHVTTVEAKTGTLDDVHDRYEFVMANIQADVLQAIAPAMPARLVPGGALALSGLLVGDADSVRAAYEKAGLRFEARQDEGEWAALLFRAP